MSRDSRLVYSTERGRIKAPEPATPAGPPPGAAVLVRRESKGRGGKTVTAISQLPLAGDAIKQLAKDLKKACGVGGTSRDYAIEIQGDHRAAVKDYLEQQGYTVKLAGG